MIIRCTCQHEAQDELHGPGNRVANKCKESGGSTPYRCTVCKKEHVNPVPVTRHKR